MLRHHRPHWLTFVLVAWALGAHAQIGVNWFSRSSGTTNRGPLAYGSAKFVAVTDAAGIIEYSADGATWTARNTGMSVPVKNIAWLGSRFIAVGGREMATSSDGITWTASAPFNANDSINAVTGIGSTLVAVGGNGSSSVVHFSTNNGTTWTTPTLSAHSPLRAVIRTATLYIAVGDANTILTSPTGAVWTQRPAYSGFSSSLTDIATNGSLIVAVGTSSSLFSTNGFTWDSNHYITSDSLAAVRWTGSLFVAVGTGRYVSTSPDGTYWTRRSLDTSYTLKGLASDGHQLLAVGTAGRAIGSDAMLGASFDASSLSISESAGHANITVTLSAPATTPVSLPISVSGTAVANTDYIGIPSSISFTAGESVKHFTITLYNNSTTSTDKTIVLTLNPIPTVHAINYTKETITILDDEQPTTVRFASQRRSVPEHFGAVPVEVSLSRPYHTPLSIPLIVDRSPGKASAADYAGLPSIITFLSGETSLTFFVDIVDDDIEEPDENIVLSFGSASSVTPEINSAHTITIQDNDPESTPGRRWRLRNPVQTAKNLNDIAFRDSTIVAVGEDDQALASSDHGVHWTSHFTGTFGLSKIINGGGTLVAIQYTGSVATSTDGIHWTSQTLSVSNPQLSDVVWTGTQFVITGVDRSPTQRPTIYASADGVTWKEQPIPVASGSIWNVAWNGLKLIAFGTGATSGKIALTSADGLNWQDESRSLSRPVSFSNVIWAGTVGQPLPTDRFVGFDDSSSCYTSPDGFKWTIQPGAFGTSTASSGVWNSRTKQVVVVTGNAIAISANSTFTSWTRTPVGVNENLVRVAASPSEGLLALGDKRGIYASSNGKTWININPSLGAKTPLLAVASSGPRFVAVGGDRYRPTLPVVMTSPDGIVWTNVPMTIPGTFTSVASSGSTFVAVGPSGLICSSITNGATWTQRTCPTGKTNLNCVIWAGNQFVAVGGLKDFETRTPSLVGSRVLTSPDGITWKQQHSPHTQPFLSVAWNGSTFVAVGSSSSGSSMPIIATTSDVADWSTTATSAIRAWELVSVVYGGGKFVAVGSSDQAEYSYDGLTWTSSQAFGLPGTFITSLCWTGTEFIVGGSTGAFATSLNGDQWTAKARDSFRSIEGLACNGSMAVAVGFRWYEDDEATIYSSGIPTTPATRVVSFDRSSPTVPESAGTVNVTVSIQPAPMVATTINYSVYPGESLLLSGPSADVLLPATQTISFQPGQDSQSIAVRVVDDHIDEDDETIGFTLHPTMGVTLGGTFEHTLTVTDDDTTPTINITTGADAILNSADPSTPLYLKATATGSPPLSYQWLLNGKPIAGATSGAYYLSTATTTNGGTYRCAVSNPVAKVVLSANSVEIGVIEHVAKSIPVSSASDVVLTQAASSNLDLHWRKNSSALDYAPLPTEAKYSTTKSSLTLLKASLGSTTNTFDCQLTLKSNSLIAGVGNQYVTMPITGPPVLPATITLPDAAVSATYDHIVDITSGPETIRVTGLPPGLAGTAIPGSTSISIKGTPSASGTYNVTFTASNALGTLSRTAKLIVAALPASFAGTLVGLLERHPSNRNLGGVVTVTLTKDGHFTGSFVIGNSKQAFSGQAYGDSSLSSGSTIVYGGGNLYRISFNYDETHSASGAQGTLTIATPPNITLNPIDVRFTLYRKYSGTDLAAYAKRFNFSSEYATTPAIDSNVPRGIAFGSATINATGAIAWAGRLGDGLSVFTASSFLTFDSSASLYLPLYNGFGSYKAQPKFSLGAPHPTILSAPGDVTWIKLQDTSAAGSRTYPDGWGTVEMTLSGLEWSPPKAGAVALGLNYTPHAANALLTFSDGGTLATPPSPSLSVNLQPSGHIDIYPAISNPRKTTLFVANSTGLITGSFSMDDFMPNGTLLKRPVSFYGQIQQDTNTGVGSFVLPQLPEDTLPMPLPSTTPVLTGSLLLKKYP